MILATPDPRVNSYDCVTICYICKSVWWDEGGFPFPQSNPNVAEGGKKLSRDFLANINFDPSWKMEANINSIKWKTER